MPLCSNWNKVRDTSKIKRVYSSRSLFLHSLERKAALPLNALFWAKMCPAWRPASICERTNLTLWLEERRDGENWSPHDMGEPLVPQCPEAWPTSGLPLLWTNKCYYSTSLDRVFCYFEPIISKQIQWVPKFESQCFMRHWKEKNHRERLNELCNVLKSRQYNWITCYICVPYLTYGS